MNAAVRGLRKRWVVLAIATSAAVAGCVSAPTPQLVYVTPAPTPLVIYVSVTPAPTPTPEATPTPLPTLDSTPTPTPTPIPVPTSRAAACTGSASNKAFFAEAAAKVKFDVYCAVLPKGWYLKEGDYTGGSGGKLSAVYTNKSGDIVGLEEGAYCTSGPAVCGGVGVDLGAASFGGLAGELMQYGPTYAVIVKPGTAKAYAMITNGVTAAQTKAFASAMARVPRS